MPLLHSVSDIEESWLWLVELRQKSNYYPGLRTLASYWRHSFTRVFHPLLDDKISSTFFPKLGANLIMGRKSQPDHVIPRSAQGKTQQDSVSQWLWQIACVHNISVHEASLIQVRGGHIWQNMRRLQHYATLHFTHTEYLRISHYSQNKHRFFPYQILIGWSFKCWSTLSGFITNTLHLLQNKIHSYNVSGIEHSRLLTVTIYRAGLAEHFGVAGPNCL